MIPHLPSLARLILPCLLLGATLANAECVPSPDAPPPTRRHDHDKTHLPIQLLSLGLAITTNRLTN